MQVSVASSHSVDSASAPSATGDASEADGYTRSHVRASLQCQLRATFRPWALRSSPPRLRRDWARPLPHLHRDWARPCPHLHRDWARPLPHLHRDWARPCHICIGTGLTPCHIRIGTGLAPCHICTGTGVGSQVPSNDGFLLNFLAREESLLDELGQEFVQARLRCVYEYVYVYTHTHTHPHTHARARTHTHTHVYACRYIASGGGSSGLYRRRRGRSHDRSQACLGGLVGWSSPPRRPRTHQL